MESFRFSDDFVFLTNDLGAFGLDALREKFGNRVFNVGIQEQNLVSVAAGMALAGQVPVLYGITAHVLGRAYEQIRIDLSYSRVRGVVLGMGPGYTYGDDGPTHQAPHDLPLLATLPKVHVYVPTNPLLAYRSTREALASDGLSWVSVDKVKSSPEFPLSPEHLSGWRRIHEGLQGTILVSGFMTGLVLQLAKEFDLTLIEIYRPLPLPETVLSAINAERPILVVEETYPSGTVVSQVSRCLNARVPLTLLSFGLSEPTSLGVVGRMDEARATVSQVRHVCEELRNLK
jgi:transketolase